MAITPTNHHTTPKEKPTGNSNSTAGSGEAINGTDSDTDTKAYASLRAAFALQGHALHRTNTQDTPATYWAERWGLVRYLPTIDDARRFLAQIGGRM